MNIEEKKLPDKYIKANLQEGETNRITTVLDKTKKESLNTTTTIEGASEAYKLYTGTLKEKESKTFHLRIWMDEGVLPVEDSMNANYKGKVSITTSYKEDPFKESGTLAARSRPDSTENYYRYSSSITKVVFEPELKPKENASFTYDVSASGTEAGSVMAYLVLNEKESTEETDSYTLYIQGKGGVKANSNSSNLFHNFKSLKNINGLENFDVSRATNMQYMFAFCNSLTTLDLSNFDTLSVTNMEYMFYNCSSLTMLDVSNFGTSSVTDMGSMFSNCNNLTALDISSFDTSNVTSMQYMFSHCSRITTLDLSNFDTSSVTNMEGMFYNCRNLNNISCGENFVCKTGTRTIFMFSNCPANKPTHESWNGVTF